MSPRVADLISSFCIWNSAARQLFPDSTQYFGIPIMQILLHARYFAGDLPQTIRLILCEGSGEDKKAGRQKAAASLMPADWKTHFPCNSITLDDARDSPRLSHMFCLLGGWELFLQQRFEVFTSQRKRGFSRHPLRDCVWN